MDDGLEAMLDNATDLNVSFYEGQEQPSFSQKIAIAETVKLARKSTLPKRDDDDDEDDL